MPRDIRCPRTTVTVGRVSTVAGAVLTVVLCLVVWNAASSSLVHTIVLVVGLVTVVWSAVEWSVLLPLSARRFRLTIGANDLLVRRGGLIVRVDRIRAAKVTMVRTRSGPLLRRFDLVQCAIVTPAGEIVLPALSSSDVVVLHGRGIEQ
ncbi:PH domain-containing protein [Curtobacterium sp. RRHDQ10]